MTPVHLISYDRRCYLTACGRRTDDVEETATPAAFAFVCDGAGASDDCAVCGAYEIQFVRAEQDSEWVPR